MGRVRCKGRDAGRRGKGGPAFCSGLPPQLREREGPSAASPTEEELAQGSHPPRGCRSAPASVAFLKGQVLTTRGRGLKPRTRGTASTSGTSSSSRCRFDFRAIAERPAEQREKWSRPAAQPSRPTRERSRLDKLRLRKLVIPLGLVFNPLNSREMRPSVGP